MRLIDGPERMTAVIRHFGMIPFFRGAVPGWSVEELTAPGCWFTDPDSGGTLGPWDWKIEAVREGDIAYGKFLGGKAAFATVEWYRLLMNWRRSLPQFRTALGEAVPGAKTRRDGPTKAETISCILAPKALDAIRGAGAMEAGELRTICGVKKNVMDSVLQFLQMGTWTVTGDFQRVYRGPNLTYSGWQKASNTTPEALFGIRGSGTGPAPDGASADVPFWVKRLEERDGGAAAAGISPEQSRERLISHVLGFFPSVDRRVLEKLI